MYIVLIYCFSEQKIIQYEQYFRDLQANLNIEANCDDPNNSSNEHLQQEVFSLIMH